LIETFIEGLCSDIQRKVKAYNPWIITVVISFARREEEILCEENCQTVKVVDKPTTNKSSSSPAPTSKFLPLV
jgi:hypothetical protein